MYTRIRYENKNGTVQSKHIFVHETNGARYQVKLFPEELRYEIVDVVADRVAFSGTASRLPALKIAVKNQLEKAGIVFKDEARNRDKEGVSG